MHIERMEFEEDLRKKFEALLASHRRAREGQMRVRLEKALQNLSADLRLDAHLLNAQKDHHPRDEYRQHALPVVAVEKEHEVRATLKRFLHIAYAHSLVKLL